MFGLIAYLAGGFDTECGGVDACYDAWSCCWVVGRDGSGIGCGVCFALVEGEVSAVGQGDGGDVLCVVGVHHFDEPAGVDAGVEFLSVDGEVVAYVAQFECDGGVLAGEDVLAIGSCGAVVVVEGGFVGAHVAFVE